MGISLILEILPEKINKADWESMYEETFMLIDQYPLAMLENEKAYGTNRFVLDATTELGDDDKYWEICGDLQTKERAETFTLYRDLNHYMKWRKNSTVDEDIILTHLNDGAKVRVFSEKTQGKNYHHYMLAIACLVESRFKDAAILYGDFDLHQAQISIKWANNILDKPIDLPTLVNYDQLWNKLKMLLDKKDVLPAFYRLAHGDKELNDFIVKNFSKQDVFTLYKEEMKDYKTATQFGVIRMLINILNMGYSLIDLSEICCFSPDGPKFDDDDFIKALCSTWVFVPQEYISPMDIYTTPNGQADTVDTQLITTYLEMNGLQGRKIETYIPVDDLTKALKSIFPKKNDVEEVINKRYTSIIGQLEAQREDLNGVNLTNQTDDLTLWKKGDHIDREIVKVLENIKKIASYMTSDSKEVAAFKVFEKTKDKYSQNVLLVNIIGDLGIVLTREAWDWIENIEDFKEWMTLISAIGILKDSKTLLRTLLENKDLTYNYIMGN